MLMWLSGSRQVSSSMRQRPADTNGHPKAEVMTPTFGVCVVSIQQPSGPQKLCPYSTSASQM